MQENLSVTPVRTRWRRRAALNRLQESQFTSAKAQDACLQALVTTVSFVELAANFLTW